MDVLPGLFDSISHHGPLARCVDDARLFLSVTQGPDESDIQSVTTPLDLAGATPSSVEGMRLALSVDLGCWAVEPGIEAAVRSSASALAAAGAIVEEVDLALTPRDEAVWVELWAVFMAAYYGHLVDEHRERMDPDVLGLIAMGEAMTAVHYKRLEVERTSLWHRLAAVLEDHQALLCPTMATGPLPAAKADRIAQTRVDDGRYHANDMTAVWNLVSPCPALSVPAGLDEDGMPVGLQIVGRRWREDIVLRIGRAAELAVPGPPARPPF